ncbi:hypothetical protein FMM05_15435 [Flavobacterium zepuense]|uniref:Lipoprotein n=1 Tax=Flavobacterium zepuense TaxID=2593302 RepID=A0A552UXY2_9FLAO|nr:hypothetical protein [Flavobacterium zepuense]TRW23084.1 hypothetical protein FMM05_15435 [Flavobacterium zepuense]
MKAAKRATALVFNGAWALLLIGLQSCGTYNSKTSEIENDLVNGNFDQAITNIDKNKFLLKDRNRLLYLFEKGKMEHLKGNYEASNTLLEDAYIMIDDQIKTSVGQAVAAKFTNPMAEPYKGEDFEKVTIHYYKALNYWHMGMVNEALVEAKRINIKLLELNDKYPNNKNKYREDAFSQILQGILYETTGDINGAFIAYRNAQEIYERSNGEYFGVPLPQQLKTDLLRTTRQLGFTQEYNDYVKKFGTKSDNTAATPAGEAVIFWENGLGPAKDQIVITASGAGGIFYGSYMDGDVVQDILIPIPSSLNLGSINAIAIPKYRERSAYYTKASVVVGSNEQAFELAQDFYPIARQCLKDRMLRETIDLVARFATKKGAGALLGALAASTTKDNKDGSNDLGDLVKFGADLAGAATEKADTRNWQSLPATIGYVRVPLKEGVNKFIIKKYGAKGIDADTITIQSRRGLQIINYFDLGRTQVFPANGAVSSTTIPTADEYLSASSIVNNYFKAIGGMPNINLVKSTFATSTVRSNAQGVVTTKEVTNKTMANNTSYTKTVSNGKNTDVVIIGTDGGATVSNNAKPVKLDQDEYLRQKSFIQPYQSYNLQSKIAGTRISGFATINKEKAYAVSFTEPVTKLAVINYYSVATGLLLASKTTTTKGTEQYSITSNYTDYRDVKGVKFPFAIKTVGDDFTTEERITQLKVNEGVTDADFKIN